MANSLSHYAELERYVESFKTAIRDWYAKCKEPGEFWKRVDAVLPTTLIHVAALAYFPKAAAAGLITAAVFPEAVGHMQHNYVIQKMDQIINDNLNMTSTLNKAAVWALIIIACYLNHDPRLDIVSAFFTAKLMADMTFEKYHNNRQDN